MKHSHHSIILVDENDNQIGTTDKLSAHQKGQLHRAFSIFIFRKHNGQIELLLQQRHPDKYHCGGLWTNSCCSHPMPGEHTMAAGQRRLQEELGLVTDLQPTGSFIYQAKFDNGLTEHEYDHVLAGWFDGQVDNFNTSEIKAIRWINIHEIIQQEFKTTLFTPWFKQGFDIAIKNLSLT